MQHQRPRITLSALMAVATLTIAALLAAATPAAAQPQTGTIGNRVWLDLNQDGIQDVNEPGIEGVTVELWTATSNDFIDQLADVVQTDSRGLYEFNGLDRDTAWIVRVLRPSGELAAAEFSPQNQTGDALDSDVDFDGVSPAIRLINKATNRNIDAGFLAEGVPFDFDYESTCIDGRGAFIIDVTADTRTRIVTMRVTGLAPKSVVIDAGETKRLARTGRPDGDYTVTITETRFGASLIDQVETVDCQPALDDGILGNRVWSDDGDGIQEVNERGIADTTIRVWNSNAAGDLLSIAQETTTNTRGLWQVDGLARDTWFVVEVLPPAIIMGGYQPTSAHQGSDLLDSDIDDAGRSEPVMLDSTRVNRTVDAGFIEYAHAFLPGVS